MTWPIILSFQIHEIIDKHWCYGQSQDRVGKFPSSHLHKVEIPQLDETERLFVSIANFPGQETGDLSFAQGKIIIRHAVLPSTHKFLEEYENNKNVAMVFKF